MPNVFLCYLLTHSWFSKPLIKHYKKRYNKNEKIEDLPHYVLKLLIVAKSLIKTVQYRPTVEGTAITKVYLSRASKFVDVLIDTIEAIESDKSLPTVSTPIKAIVFDDWLVNQDDVPIRFNSFVSTTIPLAEKLCLELIKNANHTSVGYYYRHSSKILHDVKTIMELLLDFND